MKTTPIVLLLTCGLATLLSTARAQDTAVYLEPAGASTSECAYPQRIGMSYNLGFNTSVKFKNLGAFPARSNPGPATGSAVDRTYDDGFNRVDSSGNAQGQTWFWGYNNASQIQGDFVVMHSHSAAGDVSTDDISNSPYNGAQLTYNIQLGTVHHWKWGIEGAANYTAVNINDSSVMSGNVQQISDAFALNGITPPSAPYAGTFTGPGAMINSEPSSRTITTIPNGAIITGQRTLDANIWGFHLGPYFEYPITDCLGVSLSGGVAFAVVSSDFDYHQSVTIPGVGTTLSSGSGNETSMQVGGYASATLLYHFTKNFNVFTGVQYTGLTSQQNTQNGVTAELNLGGSVAGIFGVGFSF